MTSKPQFDVRIGAHHDVFRLYIFRLEARQNASPFSDGYPLEHADAGMTIPQVVEARGQALAVGPGEHTEGHERPAREQELHQDIGTCATCACNQLFHASRVAQRAFAFISPETREVTTETVLD